ncbi:MAG: ABC transporter ATP-binding protein [Bacteroidia bacterium]|nr:ABC transporter ATP-binding protein [Bacteroidia bacterium]
MIEAINLTKSYNNVPILKGVSLTINKGEVVAIVGPSGAGKSTLLQLLGTLDSPDSGEVRINGQLLTALKDNQLSAFRNTNIGFVFQFHHLLPEFTALENVCLPAYIKGSLSQAEITAQAIELMRYLGIESRVSHKPSQLSGGEQQRVAVARALINKPAVIFADEPSGNLDTQHAHELHELFFKLSKDFEQTFVIVTHNNELAKMANKLFVMRDGKLVNE